MNLADVQSPMEDLADAMEKAEIRVKPGYDWWEQACSAVEQYDAGDRDLFGPFLPLVRRAAVGDA